MAISLRERYMISSSRVSKLLREAEVDDVYAFRRGVWRSRIRVGSHEEVRGFDISVDQVARVDIFDKRNLNITKLTGWSSAENVSEGGERQRKQVTVTAHVKKKTNQLVRK